MDMLEKLKLYLECTPDAEIQEMWSKATENDTSEVLLEDVFCDMLEIERELGHNVETVPLIDDPVENILKNYRNSDLLGVFFYPCVHGKGTICITGHSVQ